MRLFIAVNFNNDTRSGLIKLRDELRSRSVRGNFTPPENLHLTLVFLGECGDKQLANIKRVIDETIFSSFELIFERIGLFRRDGGGIWWAGVKENASLLDLQRALTKNLISAGFKLETRKYSPHITLGREVITDTAPWKIEPFGEIVSAVRLMKSERIGRKLTYTEIHTKKSEV